MGKSVWLALALAAVCARAVAAGDAPRGSLVIIGGGLRVNNAEVWERIVALAGGKGARIAVLPTAAQNPAKEAQLTADALTRYGARPFVVPVAPLLAGTDVRKAADDPALAEAVRKAGGVFFTGGDQARITGVAAACRRQQHGRAGCAVVTVPARRRHRRHQRRRRHHEQHHVLRPAAGRDAGAEERRGGRQGHRAGPGLHRHRRLRRPAPARARPLRPHAAGDAGQGLHAGTRDRREHGRRRRARLATSR